MTRRFVTRLRSLTSPVVAASSAFVLALVVVGVLLLVQGRDPLSTYWRVLIGGFGDRFALSETLVAATPIMLCALSVAVAARVGLTTIGAEGQLYVGAIGATYVALAIPEASSWTLIPLMMCAACLCGGLWSGIPGLLRARFGVNETILTLLLNYVAVLLVQFLIHGPWKDPSSFSWPQSAALSSAAQLPRLGNTRIHLGLTFGLGFAFLFWVVLSRTRAGFVARVIGSNARAARYAHYPVARYLVAAMVISGAVAALAGMGQVSAIEGRLRSVLSPGYGYTGFLVAWLTRHNPVAIVFVSLLMGGLLAGADMLQLSEHLPAATLNVFQGLIFFFLLGSEQYIRRLSKTSAQATV